MHYITSLSKYRTKYCAKNDDICGTYGTNNQMKFEVTILKSNLYHYTDAYRLLE